MILACVASSSCRLNSLFGVSGVDTWTVESEDLGVAICKSFIAGE